MKYLFRAAVIAAIFAMRFSVYIAASIQWSLAALACWVWNLSWKGTPEFGRSLREFLFTGNSGYYFLVLSTETIGVDQFDRGKVTRRHIVYLTPRDYLRAKHTDRWFVEPEKDPDQLWRFNA